MLLICKFIIKRYYKLDRVLVLSFNCEFCPLKFNYWKQAAKYYSWSYYPQQYYNIWKNGCPHGLVLKKLNIIFYFHSFQPMLILWTHNSYPIDPDTFVGANLNLRSNMLTCLLAVLLVFVSFPFEYLTKSPFPHSNIVLALPIN